MNPVILSHRQHHQNLWVVQFCRPVDDNFPDGLVLIS